jgi:hypothetical protein
MGSANEWFGSRDGVQLTSNDRQNYIRDELFAWISRRDNYIANFFCSERRNGDRIQVRLPILNNSLSSAQAPQCQGRKVTEVSYLCQRPGQSKLPARRDVWHTS